ncbi:hypothetical protein [Paraburkholderia azotifigens]|uniref:Uncharacterized protein n=1 Tax=Paraburkholderia azotifigens TaxID=2057004 RepID=A0A5C6VD33_9BURK|nr:hypothetical protein [Paraburkholderia azotifigens]TXC80948.1 hypothetical protein FRZ40_42865 [Paraburkholderia azotifigens]
MDDFAVHDTQGELRQQYIGTTSAGKRVLKWIVRPVNHVHDAQAVFERVSSYADGFDHSIDNQQLIRSMK